MISKNTVGFTSDDLMEVLSAQKEVGNKYKTHFFAMFSQLLCTITEEIINKFGEEGREAIANSIKKYGLERGKRIAKLVESLGKELNLKNFFIYGDLDSKSILKYKPKIVDGNVEIIIRDCVFCNGCKEWGKEEYGKIYCEYIDHAVLEGYNPKLFLELPARMMLGDKKCHFRYLVKKD
ncbi:MAG: L-2-amino-thiazoline-4-carboxylic acid hydrolase [Candidatus Hermodarchaeota archaeon]